MEASWVATMLAGGEGMDALGRVPLDFLEQADVPGGLATTSRRDEEVRRFSMAPPLLCCPLRSIVHSLSVPHAVPCPACVPVPAPAACACAQEEKDVMGGWEPELFEDLMDPYDDEADDTEEADSDDFDAPATDY